MRTTMIACVLLCLLVFAGTAHADVPRTMSYQGVLTDSLGQRVPDGAYHVNFSIYSDPVGGYPLWVEAQTVFTNDGVFDAILGNTTPITTGFGEQRWLGIAVEYQFELTPRTQLTAAPYAHHAVWADSLVGGGGGGSDTDWLFSGDDIYRLSGRVGIGTSTPDTPLHVRRDEASVATFEVGSPSATPPSYPTAVYAAVADSANAGHFVVTGDGGALIANSYGYGNALYTAALGNGHALRAVSIGGGYAGYFSGGAGLRVEALCHVNSFRMAPGATAGYVLTSDGSGIGTWQAPPAGGEADADWMVSGDDMYPLVSGNVGIGTITPAAPLDVWADSLALSVVSGTPPPGPSSGVRAMYVAADGFKDAGWFTSTGQGTAVTARATGDGIGLIAMSQGVGDAIVGYAEGTGYSGWFQGGNGVMIIGDVGVHGGDMAVSGYLSLGVGVPTAQLDVLSSGLAGKFSSTGGGTALRADIPTGNAATFLSGASPSIYSGDPPALYAATDLTGPAASFVHSSHGDAGWFTSAGDGVGVRASSLGDGTGLLAKSLGAGNAIFAYAEGTGHSGYFQGGDGVMVVGDVQVLAGGINVVENSGGSAGHFTADVHTGVETHVVHAEVTGTNVGVTSPIAVYGKSNPVDGVGWGGYFSGGNKGVYGVSVNDYDYSICGVHGNAYAGLLGDNHGVYGRAAWGDFAAAIYGLYDGYAVSEGWAGFFVGDVSVSGTLVGGGAAALKIDHPLDPAGMYLTQPYVASSEMTTVLNGNTVLGGSGEVWVELPDWFGATTESHRYQLTCIGGFAPVYVAEKISGGRFLVAGGEPGMEISWQVTGVRHDRYAEEHRIVVEETKRPRYVGKYMHPELYGAPAENAIGRHDLDEERGN